MGVNPPQVMAVGLDEALGQLTAPSLEAVLDPRLRRWWALRRLRPDAQVIAGVPMSTASTGKYKSRGWAHLGLTTTLPAPLSPSDWEGRALAGLTTHLDESALTAFCVACGEPLGVRTASQLSSLKLDVDHFTTTTPAFPALRR